MTTIVKLIVRAYFLYALYASAGHIIHTANKLGLYGRDAYAWPALIDGIAVIGMVMRSERWSTRTRRIGLRVQCCAGLLSLAANVYAGNTIGQRINGVMIVALFVVSEWLVDNMETRAAELARIQAAEDAAEARAAEAAAAELAAAEAAKRSAAAKQGAVTKAARKAEAERNERERIRVARKAMAA